MKPTRVYIEQDADTLVEWSRENENILHETAMDATEKMLTDASIDELVVIEFYENSKTKYPFADIVVNREDMEESLNLAQDYYVSTEEYEMALRAKNLRDLLNKNNKQTT